MQTLNVGAGRTDNEYKAAEEQRRTDLRADSREDANYFFWAAGLAPISTGLLPVRLNILVNIGALDLFETVWQATRSALSSPGVQRGGDVAGCPGRAGICRTQRPASGIPGRHGSVRG